MRTHSRRSRGQQGRRRWLIFSLAALAVLLIAGEGYRVAKFTLDVHASRAELLSIKDDLDLSRLQQSEEEVLAKQERLRKAQEHLRSAGAFVRSDPLLFLAGPWPVIGTQAKGVKHLVEAAEEATNTGLAATNVALAYARYERDPDKTSIQDALSFLKSQEEPMARVESGLKRLKTRQAQVGGGLIGPAASARDDLDTAVAKLEELVEGYRRADTLLPELLGYEGPRRYLVLPQNDTELFPSGGLISSYGIATFDGGRLVSMDLEYFGELFDRWQRQTKEYIEPPGPLKNYLKQDYSWGLGEAGWYPDFPTTSELARSFVAKGGVPETDGVIAIDLQFVSSLLDLTGPIPVPEYNVTVTAENISELTLELTRDDAYVPGRPTKTFLSYLSRAVLNRVFTAPKDQWVDMLRLLDRAGRERHLQLYFSDPDMQGLTREYGFDGSLDPTSAEGDFLLIADTSVKSTKLNLILETKARLDLTLDKDGTARTRLTYEVQNPFPEWKQGRDAKLVKALMLDGVYGSYLRLYVNPRAELQDVLINNRSAGPEQNLVELGKRAFGRFFPVLPGAKSSVQFVYETPGVFAKTGKNTYRYQLYLQKEAGTEGLPLELRLNLPKGAKVQEVGLDGKPVNSQLIETSLTEDRTLEVVFTAP